MATWHINADTGSDSNDGLSAIAAFATIAKAGTVAGDGDTVYFAGIHRLTSGATFTALSDVTYAQEPGGTQADIRCEVTTGLGWTSLGSNRWSKTLATGLGSGGGSSAMNGELLFNWNTTTDAGGRPTGHLRYVAGSGSLNTYDYNNATGLTTINVAMAVNGTKEDISYSVGSAFQCLSLDGGTGNRVEGLYFSLNCGLGSSYGLFLHNQQDTVVSGCKFRDAQWHHAGFLNHTSNGVPAVGNRFEDCEFFGGAAGLGHAVHYAENAVPISGAGWFNCTFHGHRYLSPTGAIVAGQSTMAQIPSLSHGDSGECVTDILADGCTYIEYEPGWLPISVTQQQAQSATWTWSDCPARVDRCTFRGDGTVQTGASVMQIATSLALRRCKFDYRNLGPSGLAGTGGVGGIILNSAALQFMLFESCEFIINGRDDANDTRIIGTYGFAGNELRFMNCGFAELSTGHGSKKRLLFSPGFRTDVYIRAIGCDISFGESYSGNELFGEDSGLAAGNHAFTDNAYRNVGVYSENTSIDADAEWLALVDTTRRVVSTVMFPNLPNDLDFPEGAYMRSVARQTFSLVPSVGINGTYQGLYGPYQYSYPVTSVAGGISSGMMRNTCMVIRKAVTTSAASGGIVETWTIVYPLVRCSIQGATTREDFKTGQERRAFSFVGYFPASMDLRHTDRIRNITGPGGLTNRTLEIEGPALDDAGLMAYIRVPLAEVPGND